MEINNLFSRCKCNSKWLHDLITKWTQNESWEFDDFLTFLKLVGVTTPVSLSSIDTNNKNFKCVTADNKDLTISLIFRTGVSDSPGLQVTEGIETKRYNTNSKSKYNPQPKVIYQSRKLESRGKSLHSSYCDFFCRRILKIDDTHTLNIEFDEPDKYKKDKSNIRVLTNASAIEDYLFGLDNSVSVSKVYEKIVSLLNLSDEDINKTDEILISYIEGDDKTKQVLAKIHVLKGVIQEYAMREGDEFFQLFRNRSWRYILAGTRIIYSSVENEYIFSVTGIDTAINTLNPADTLKRVNEKNSKMWNVFN